jgi:type III pantothenate kinase
MHAELGSTCPVVVTGGLAEVIAKETAIITAVEPNLTLNGLRMIFERNH